MWISCKMMLSPYEVEIMYILLLWVTDKLSSVHQRLVGEYRNEIFDQK